MQRTAFTLVVLLTLVLAGLNGVMVALMATRLNVLLPGPFAQMAHFTEPHHRIHDLAYSFLLGTAVVGMIAQLRAPSKNVAGQLMALIPFVALVGTLLATNASVASPPWLILGASTVLATTLHPRGRDLLRSISPSRVDRLMCALIIVAAVPLLALASTSLGLQRDDPSDHAAMGHFGYLAALGFTVVGTGLLATFRPDGWRLAAWVAGVLSALVGITSLLYPDATSSLDPVWALAAIAWGVVFVAAAEFVRARAPAAAQLTVPLAQTSGQAGARPWVPYLIGIIVLAAVLGFVVMHLSGGGPALHAPAAGGH